MALVFAGKLKPVLDRTFPLSETPLAEAYLGGGKQMGKVTIGIS
jgi:NADPH:quinone reductase-like Zn-dependent oxidoreductase